jgi:hypothetical protein
MILRTRLKVEEIDLAAVHTPDDFRRALNIFVDQSGIDRDELALKAGMPGYVLDGILDDSDNLPTRHGLAQLISALSDNWDMMVQWGEALNRSRRPRRGIGPGLGALIPTAPSRDNLKQAEEELVASSENLELGLLWEVTHERLDYYHEIATGQAKVSFRNAQIAMAVGFLFLVVFAVMALYAHSTTVSVVTGSLGAVGAAFAGYTSRTFVQSQQSSAAHLRSYFDQPLELSRYLAAERVISSMRNLSEEQRTQLARDLVQGIVSLPSTKEGKGEKGNG